MKKLLVTALLIFAGINSLCGIKTAWGVTEKEEAILDKPKIEIAPLAWDFGEISEGEIKTYEFEVKNMGGEELVIQNTFSSCGCTKSSISSTNILPGELAKLKVSFDSKGFQPGKTERIIYVNSNDPDDPVKKVIVSAEIQESAK